MSSARLRPWRWHLRLWWSDPPCLRWIYTLRRWICRFGGSAGRGAAAAARGFLRLRARVQRWQWGTDSGGGDWRGPCGNLPSGVCGWARGWAWLRWPGRVRPGWTCGRTCGGGGGAAKGGGGWGRAARWSPPFSPCSPDAAAWRRQSLGLWTRRLAVWSGASILRVLFASQQRALGWPTAWVFARARGSALVVGLGGLGRVLRRHGGVAGRA
jgi:hypothetical protein